MDSMSDGSRRDSTGSLGLFGRLRKPILGGRSGSTDDADKEVEQYSGFTNIFRRNAGRTEARANAAAHDFNNMGYNRFVMPNGQQIFVQSESEETMFSDDEEFYSTQPEMKTELEMLAEAKKESVDAEEPELDIFDIPACFLAVAEPPVVDEQVVVEEKKEEDFTIQSEAEEPSEQILDKSEFDELWGEDSPSESNHVSIEDLFDNVARGPNEFVETSMGIVNNGVVVPKEEVLESTAPVADVDAPVGLMEKEEPEREMIAAAPVGPDDDAPEVFVPKVEDYTDDAKAALMLSAPVAVPALPAPVVVPVRIVPWTVTEEAAFAYGSFLEFRDVMEQPEIDWVITDEAAFAFAELMSMVPDYGKVEVPWEITEEAAVAFADLMAIVPDYTISEVPWEVDEATASAFRAFKTIQPETPWDVTDEASVAFADLMSMESTYAEPEVQWDVTEEASMAFSAFTTIVPEYPVAHYEMPEWDVSEAAAEAYCDYKAREQEYFQQEKFDEQPVTEIRSNIEVPALEERIDEFDALALGITPTFAKTESGDAGVDHKVFAAVNHDNLAIGEGLKGKEMIDVTPRRMVFKDGRLQRVPIEAAPVISKAEMPMDIDYSPAPEVKAEPIRAPLAFENEIEKPTPARLVAKKVEGVNFDFGQSEDDSGMIRFIF